MAKPVNNATFDEVWARMREHAGEVFLTKLRCEFVYTVNGDIFRTIRTDYHISKSDFRRVFDLWPISGPGEINQDVRGPLYIWGIFW
jgi:hypothetical protein